MVASGAEAWRPIETAPWDVPVLMYAPPEALYEYPHGHGGEYRVGTRKNWTWATHWVPLPEPPSAGAAVQEATQTQGQDQPEPRQQEPNQSTEANKGEPEGASQDTPQG
jgi:hypothetical protein